MKGRLAILLVAVMMMSVMGSVMVSVLPVKAVTTVNNPRIADDGTVTWDKITFGSYPQEAEFTDEPIKWRILDIDENGNAFLLADKALDCKPYNEKDVEWIVTENEGQTVYTRPDYSCTWKTSTLRNWLNGTNTYAGDENAFINAAFSPEEKEAIIETTVVNDDNTLSNEEEDSNTTDKVYLLSIGEITTESYGLKGFLNARQAKATDYAKYNGTYVSTYVSDNFDYFENCEWWLRSPVPYSDEFNYMEHMKYVGIAGDAGNWKGVENNIGVRPVLHVNLSSPYVKDAGKVTVDGLREYVMPGTYSTKDSSEYSKPSIASGGVIGATWDCVYFGKYKNKVTFEKKPIEWRVLSVSGNNAFVVSDKVLDYKSYNENGVEKTDSYGSAETDYSCTWETSTLRYWLNGTDTYASDKTAFINKAFTDEEKNSIIETEVFNDDTPSSNIEGDNNTTDKVYLLSIGEASNTSYGFDDKFNEESTTRNVKDTDYVKVNKAYLGEYNYGYPDYWWLRSPGSTASVAAYVNDHGYGFAGGINVYDARLSVRPALHVNLSSSCVKAAGQVSSNGEVVTTEEIEEQKMSDKVVKLISSIGTVTKDSKTAIDSARSAYNTLSETAKAKVTNYSVLQAAESKYEELTKDDAGNRDDANTGNNNSGDSGNLDSGNNGVNGNEVSNNTDNGNKNNNNGGSTGGNSKTTELQAATEVSVATTSTEQTITTPAKVSLYYAKNSKKKAVVIKWKKIDNVMGYEVSYALNKKFTKNKKAKTLSNTIFTAAKLKKGKTYYFRVRAYNQDSNGNKLYGKWSSVKKVKIKK